MVSVLISLDSLDRWSTPSSWVSHLEATRRGPFDAIETALRLSIPNDMTQQPLASQL